MNRIFLKRIALLSLSTFLLWSCSKKKDVVSPNTSTEQVDNSVERYYPLAVGNTWSYEGSSVQYDVTITGKSKIGNTEYYDAYNTKSAASGQIRYQGGKYYQAGKASNNQHVELLFLDENAKVGDKWKMGEITQNSGFTSITTLYNCEVVSRPATYTLNNVEYKDIFVIKTSTTIKYTIPEQYKALLGEEYEAMLEEFSNMGSITSQLSYYARGVGFIDQTSESMPQLNVSLVSHSLKGR